MKFIIDFYQSLDALNVIIFWGIIIVILLLIVFIILMISKNKKNKIEKNNKNYNDELYSDEIALPSNSRDTLIMKDDNLLIQEEKQTSFEPFIISKQETLEQEKVEIEKNFHAEEHVMKYDNEMFNLSHVKKNAELTEKEGNNESNSEKTTFQMPTKPYERNVLREMSLGQTSPIGIVKNDHQNIKPINKSKEVLENQNTNSKQDVYQTTTDLSKTHPHVEKTSSAISTTITEKAIPIYKEEVPKQEQNIWTLKNSYSNIYHNNEQEEKIISESNKENIISPSKENSKLLLEEVIHNNKIEHNEINQKDTTSSNAKFLEEVSKKLAEADIPDEINRTDYELQQEEDAIISYKELMAKKDTIKTVDEEDAVISIQELTARKNNQEKLYNLTEEEENNDFLDELKKFRNDLN